MSETERRSASKSQTGAPSDLITQAKWDHALFTTYSLSLTFYETQIHKLGLARNGCRDIRIVADADGYQLSLSERQSHRVGNEYRLTPVALPTGVFHPKLVWLAGKELDLLLIGSGNLTFGGFGKNLECLEVIRSDLNPGVFSDAGALMRSWQVRQDLRFTDSDWLAFWMGRGEAIGHSGPKSGDSEPSLLHSTSTSIGDQLVGIIRQSGQVMEVCSLSPYYDPDADGILRFAESLAAPRLTIGLLPAQESATTFPFWRHRKTTCQVSAARFSATEDSRRLHAKILEIRMADGSAYILTGSVNATRKSLLSSDNIETGVLRRYPNPAKRPFSWTPCESPPSHQELDFGKAGLGNRVLVSASLTGDGQITGTVVSRSDPAGTWKAELTQIDGRSTEFAIDVSASGAFSESVSNMEVFQFATGLQLHIAKEHRSGSGWVSVEGLLLAARRGFLPISTLLRFMADNADESDCSELLRYLSTSAMRHLPAFSSSRTSARSGESDCTDEAGKGSRSVSIDLSRLVPRDANSKEQPGGEAGSARDEAILNNYMRRIRDALLRMPRNEQNAVEVEETGDDRVAFREAQNRERDREQLRDALGRFQAEMRRLVAQLSAEEDRAAALCMWLETAVPVLFRLNEPAAVEMLLIQWLTHCLSGKRIQNSSDIAGRHILGAILTLAAAELARDQKSEKRLSRLHEQLDAFCGDEPVDLLCRQLELFDPNAAPLAADLLKGLPSAPSLSSALEAVLRVPTARQQIDMIVRAAEHDRALPAKLPILSLSAGAAFAAQVKSGRLPKVLPLSANAASCPHCHFRLRKTNLLEVQKSGFGICSDCNRFLMASI